MTISNEPTEIYTPPPCCLISFFIKRNSFRNAFLSGAFNFDLSIELISSNLASNTAGSADSAGLVATRDTLLESVAAFSCIGIINDNTNAVIKLIVNFFILLNFVCE